MRHFGYGIVGNTALREHRIGDEGETNVRKAAWPGICTAFEKIVRQCGSDDGVSAKAGDSTKQEEDFAVRRAIADSVVVITGASSGIGRATALEFARKGAAVVLAARREHALHELADECKALGGRALAVPADVTNEEAVRNLAQQAVETFGRVDVWVNNAAVTLFARLEEAPPEVYRRVMETNFFGYYYGMRAVLPHFRERGSGVLVNVASIVSEITQPYTSAYVASKFAIRALSDCLRMELTLDDARDIHICTVMPATIDTPLFNQAANFSGRGVKAMDPVLPAERVAKAILCAARHPRREVVVGGVGRIIMLLRRLAPGYYERSMACHMDSDHLTREPAAATEGNLFDPMPQYATVSGGWRPQESGNGWSWFLGALAVMVPLAFYWARRQGAAVDVSEKLAPGLEERLGSWLSVKRPVRQPLQYPENGDGAISHRLRDYFRLRS